MSAVAFAGLDPCVHCGFCLQACPTFLVTGDEADGPRGRIVLMQAMASARLDASDPHVISHLDRCLGCRGCEPVCPSGVSYGPALEEARRLMARARPLPLGTRLVHGVMAEGWIRRPLLALTGMVRPLARRFAGPSRLGFLCGMLAATRPRHNGMTARRHVRVRDIHPVMPSSRPAVGSEPADHAPAALFRGCIMSGLFSHVHHATERVLGVNGYRLIEVQNQACCGALHAHAGQHDTAMELARRNVIAFRTLPSDAHIAVNSAGCGAMLKEYGRLLAEDGLGNEAVHLADRVRDVTELLAERGPRRGGELPLRVAYDPPCHLLHAQRVADAPATVFDAIPGLTRVAHGEAELCCGSAGSYSLSEPELSREVLNRKVAALQQSGPEVVVTGNPGCAMQIGAGLLATGTAVPVVHPVELLDESYTRAGLYAN